MEANRINNIASDNRINAGASGSARSDLALASAARIEAAQQALTNVAVPPAARPQLADFTPIEGAAAQGVPFTQSVTIPPEPTAQELAAMAADVYTPGQSVPAGWSIATAAELAGIGLSENMLSSPQSEFRAEVYVREFADQTSYVVAFRGTQSASDWGANLQQGVGIRTDHYNRALEIGQRLIVPEGARMTLTGHSLGGGLASAASIASETNAVTFNAAGLSDRTIADAEAIAGADGRVDIPDISAFYVRGEILSTLQDGGDRMVGILLGAGFLDMPEAVGMRIPLDPVRPDDMRWYQDNPVARHMMDYVTSSLPSS